MPKSRRFSYLCVLINRMNTLKRILFSAFAIAACVSCGATREPSEGKLVVTIEPLRYIVEAIVGDDLEVETLVPPGASPETYEPTPRQMRAMEDAEIIFSTGVIDFERVVLGKATSPERFVELQAGIELIASEHEHAHHDKDLHATHSHSGVDPHIWVSPRALAQMARTAYSKIHELYPDSTSYTVGYEQLAARLTELDRNVSERLAASAARSFMIFHPALTYYARDYGLRQIALETDGKEPSARELAETVALARAENISKVLYQNEFPRRIVEVAAAEIGAEPVEIDILGYDITANILKITDIIAEPQSSHTTTPTRP
jgi:zinc transport system substrate-binding protein